MTPTFAEVRAAWEAAGVETLHLPAADVAQLPEPARSWLGAGTLPVEGLPWLPSFGRCRGFLQPLTAASWGPGVPDGLENWRIVGVGSRDNAVAVHGVLGSVACFPHDGGFVPVPVSTSVAVLATCILAAFEAHRTLGDAPTPAHLDTTADGLDSRIREIEPDPSCRRWWSQLADALRHRASEQRLASRVLQERGRDLIPDKLSRVRHLVSADDRIAAADLLYDILEHDERCLDAWGLLVELHLRSGDEERAGSVLAQAELALGEEVARSLRKDPHR